MKERLKNNIAILKEHNLTHRPVFHITGGQKYEIVLIDEIVEDCEEIFNDEEQGLIVKFPCKVGDKVLVNRDTWNDPYITDFVCIGRTVFYYGEIIGFAITKKQFLVKVKVYKSGSIRRYTTKRYPMSAFSKTLFLTRAEAEKKLAELQAYSDMSDLFRSIIHDIDMCEVKQ